MADEDKELHIELSEQVKAAMEANPEMAASLREFFSMLRQSTQAVQAGRYANLGEAMEALGCEAELIEDGDGDGVTGTFRILEVEVEPSKKN